MELTDLFKSAKVVFDCKFEQGELNELGKTKYNAVWEAAGVFVYADAKEFEAATTKSGLITDKYEIHAIGQWNTMLHTFYGVITVFELKPEKKAGETINFSDKLDTEKFESFMVKTWKQDKARELFGTEEGKRVWQTWVGLLATTEPVGEAICRFYNFLLGENKIEAIVNEINK